MADTRDIDSFRPPRGRDIIAEFNRAKIRRNLKLASTHEPVRIGSRGRYELLELIGAGGMGTVFRARDSLVDLEVAIKVLNSSAIDVESTTSLLREAKLLASVRHPHVVVVYDVGEIGDEYFVVMDYVPGGTLRTWQFADGRELAEIVSAYERAGDGLAAAHEADVVHRDFKPDNVFVSADGSRVVVGDFGLARPVSEDSLLTDELLADAQSAVDEAATTQLSVVGGTPGYLAPELQYPAPRPGDPLADQYSFCVSLWEAVDGSRPFGRTRGEWEALPIRPPHMPRWLFRVLRRGLSQRPSARYPDMHALLDDLHRSQRRRRYGRAATYAIAATGVASVVLLGLRDDPCADSGAPMQQTWNPEIRASVATAIERVGLPYAAPVSERALAILDRSALRWKIEARTLCEVEDLALAERERREHCLGLWHDRMRQRVELLQHPTERDVERVLELLEPLQDADNLCTAPPPVIEDPLVRESIELSKLHESLADNTAAMAQSSAAVERARAGRSRCRPESDYSNDLGQALGRHGEALARNHDYAGALTVLDEAVVHNLACEDDLAFIDNRILGARILAGRWFEPDLAKRALAEAEAMLVRIAAPERGARRAQFEKAAGKIALVEGDFAEARRRYTAGLDLLDDSEGQDLLLAVELQSSIGEAFQYEGRYLDAVVAYERAQTQIEAVLGSSHPMARKRAAQCAVNLGLAALESRNVARAEAEFASVIGGPWSDLAIKAYVGMLSARVTPGADVAELAPAAESLLDLSRSHPASDRLTHAEVKATAGQILALNRSELGLELLSEARDLYAELGDAENMVRTGVILASSLCFVERWDRCRIELERVRGSAALRSDANLAANFAAVEAALDAAESKQIAPAND